MELRYEGGYLFGYVFGFLLFFFSCDSICMKAHLFQDKISKK
jgi:hypothetical protein